MRHVLKLAALAGLLTLGREAGAVNASNPVDVEVWAQMSGTLQITVISATSYDYGVVAGSSVTVSTTTFDIKNTGSGLTETYQIKGNNSTSGNWTIAAAPAANTFTLEADFSFPSAPAAWTKLTTAYQSSDNVSVFNSASENGLSTTTNTVRHLWTRFSAPTSSGFGTKQRVQIDINAITP